MTSTSPTQIGELHSVERDALREALGKLAEQWRAEAERTQYEWYNDAAALEGCASDIDELLNKGTE